jgi:hypothetical protein
MARLKMLALNWKGTKEELDCGAACRQVLYLFCLTIKVKKNKKNKVIKLRMFRSVIVYRIRFLLGY